jgi:heme exporter protein A
MIEVNKLAKSFGSHIVLRQLDLVVCAGDCMAIVGPNGAGKTTLFRILASLSKPTGGQVRLAGLDMADFGEEIRRRIGFLSHQPLLYEYLSGEENLRFYGRMYDVPALEGRIGTVLEHVGLIARRHDLVHAYSRGMRQRLAIARTLLHDPPILLLDEPYTGLDQQAEEMLDRLVQMGGGARTILMTTHNLEQGLRLSSRIAILSRGRIAYEMDRGAWDPDGFRHIYRQKTAEPAR